MLFCGLRNKQEKLEIIQLCRKQGTQAKQVFGLGKEGGCIRNGQRYFYLVLIAKTRRPFISAEPILIYKWVGAAEIHYLKTVFISQIFLGPLLVMGSLLKNCITLSFKPLFLLIH